MIFRVALGLAYEGTDFHGWEKQTTVPTIQETLETAIKKAFGLTAETVVAGRTDAGVHATQQICHLDLEENLPVKAWTLAVNDRLPGTIRILWAQPVPEDFHARFGAAARAYRYLIAQSSADSVFSHRHRWIQPKSLDLERIAQAAAQLVGSHDFSTFRSAHCQSHQPVRTIHRLTISPQNSDLAIDIEADGFLHNMVRIIVGTLIEVGTGERSIESITAILAAKDRRLAGPTAPPQGLYFCGAHYPQFPQIPAYRWPK